MTVLLGVLLLVIVYSVFYLLPPIEGLGYLARIAIFHIPVAWVSVLGFALSAFWAIRYLQTNNRLHDIKSVVASALGLVCCMAATVSGAIFARLTWGSYWNWDPRQTSITILLLVYFAYHALRFSVEHEEIRSRIAAAYSIFATATMPFLVFIIPRMQFSLHPSPVINQTGKIQMDPVFASVLASSLFFFTLLFFYVNRILVQKMLMNRQDANQGIFARKG